MNGNSSTPTDDHRRNPAAATPSPILIVGESSEWSFSGARVEPEWKAAVGSLRSSLPAIVVMDSRLPGADLAGWVTYLRGHAATEFLPILLIVGPGKEAACMAALKAGADDFLGSSAVAGEWEARIVALLKAAAQRPVSANEFEAEALIAERRRADDFLSAQRALLERVAGDVSLPEALKSIARMIEEQSPGTEVTIYLQEEGTDSEERDVAQGHWTVPIQRSDEQCLGSIDLRFAEPRSATPHEQNVARVLAHTAAVAIELHATRRELARTTEESIRRSRLYDAILSTTPDLAYIFDLEHRFIFANEALLAMWGKTWDQAVGRNCLELGYEPWHAEMHNREIDAVVFTKSPIRGEVPFNGTSGRRIYDYIFAPVFNAAGEVEAVAGTTRDVTERKREEERAIFLGDLTRKLALLPQGSDILRTTTEAMATFLGVRQCSFAECFEDSQRINILSSWSADGNPVEGQHQLSDLASSGWPFKSSQLLVCEDVALRQRAPQDVARHQVLRVGSYAIQTHEIAPGRLVLFGVTHDQPRVWLPEETSLLDEVITRVWPLVEKSRTEEALSTSRMRLALVSDHVPALISHLDCALKFHFANARYEEWHGLSSEEVSGKDLREVWGEDVYRHRKVLVDQVLRGEQVSFEGQAVHRKLGLRDLEFSLVPEIGSDGKVAGFYKMAIDITERKQTEEILMRQGERLRLLWEAAGILLTSDDADLMLQRVFDTIAPHLGLDTYLNFMLTPEGDAMRLRSSRGLTDEETAQLEVLQMGQALCGTVALSRTPMVVNEVQHCMDPKAGVVRKMGLQAYICNPLVAGGQLLGTLSFGSRRRTKFSEREIEFVETISHYVTAAYVRLKLLESLRDSDKRKDQFLATLAHELRNPLAPILTGLEVIMASRGRPLEVERVAAMMRRQTGQMIHLIDDLLDMSRITTGKFILKKTTVRLDEVIQNAIEASRPLIEEYQHELHVALEPMELEADPHRVAQVVSNLLSNAAKYTPPRGRIDITTARAGQVAKITVRDNGQGVESASQRRIFDMFEQEDAARQEGLGIGLTLVRTLVEMHGGSVSMTSAGKGLGSAFTIELPIEQAATVHETESNEASENQATRKRRRVMVVDDGRSAADVLAMFLDLEGMETAVAYDGEEAVARAAEFHPDLVFMDLGMPRMDGFEAARIIRARQKNVILIALSGWGRDEDKRRANEAGFDGHAVKPVTPDDLRRFLKLL